MSDVLDPEMNAVRYRVVGPRSQMYELDAGEITDRIRGGSIKPGTLVALLGSEDFLPASHYPEFAQQFPHEIGTGELGDDLAAVSPRRIITYLTLAGLGGAMMMGFIAPLCLIIGVLPRFLITSAAFGAVLGLGVHSAMRDTDTRLVNITAAGFAAGGLVAWLFSSGGDFTALHGGIMGCIGGASLAYGLGLPRKRSVALVAAATILFPIAAYLPSLLVGRTLPMNIPMVFSPLVFLIAMVIPALPYAVFGCVVGIILSANRIPTASTSAPR